MVQRKNFILPLYKSKKLKSRIEGFFGLEEERKQKEHTNTYQSDLSQDSFVIGE